jgi:hypothetical protein
MSKNPTGRPVVTIDPKQVELLAGLWLTKEAAADFLGVSRDTLFNRLRTDPEIEAAWHRGRAKTQASTMQGLIQSARNGSVRAQCFLAERICGLKEAVTLEGEVTTRYVVEIPPEEPAATWQANYNPARQDGPANDDGTEPPDAAG